MNIDKSILDNDYVFALLSMLTIIYASQVRIELPEVIRNLFENDIFRVVFLSLLLVYRFDKTPQVSILISIVFLLTMHHLNQQEIKENFQHVEAFQTSIRNMKKLNINKM